LAGLLSLNHGSYAGLSVPMVIFPAACVSSAPGAQAAPEAEADAPAEGLASSAGAQAARVAIRTAALLSAVRVFLLGMDASLEHVPTDGAVRRHPVMSCNNPSP
jgi:hypothetical protein